ncbi:MAG: LPS assembly lipoprotein LptE [Hyphomicrobiaceae bacterium]
MWWLKQFPMLRWAPVAVVVSVLAAGCGEGGFRPMYAATADGSALSEKLAAIEFATIPGRVGQRIRNELVFESTGGGGQQGSAYRLEVTVTESLTSTLVQVTGDSKSQIYNLEAKFRLVRLKDKKLALEGTSHARAAFERFPSIFSNVRAREDAENRAAKSIASDLRTRLAAYIASQ